VLDFCTSQGVVLQLEGESLRYRGRKKALTPALLTELLANKAEILALLLEKQKRPLWAVLENSRVEPFESLSDVPTTARSYCYEGDKRWTSLTGEECTSIHFSWSDYRAYRSQGKGDWRTRWRKLAYLFPRHPQRYRQWLAILARKTKVIERPEPWTPRGEF
jgi:hypothetical protein